MSPPWPPITPPPVPPPTTPPPSPPQHASVKCSRFSDCASCLAPVTSNVGLITATTDTALCAWCPATSACIPLDDVEATAKACPNLLIGVDGCMCSQRGDQCENCTIDSSCAFVPPAPRRSVTLQFDGDDDAVAEIVGQLCVPWHMYEPSTGKQTLDFPDGCEWIKNWGDRYYHQRDLGPPCQRRVGNTAVVANASVTARYVDATGPYVMNGCDSGATFVGGPHDSGTVDTWRLVVAVLLMVVCWFGHMFCKLLIPRRAQADDYRRW